MDGNDQARELALGAPRVVLDGAKLGGQALVLVGCLPGRGVGTIALDRDLARRHIRALPLVGEPGAPLRELGLPLARLRQARRQIALHLVEP